MAHKKYLSLRLNDLQTEVSALDAYLTRHTTTSSAEQLLSESPEYSKLLSSHFTPLSKELSDWKNKSYKQNQAYPEQKIHKTLSDNLVRSKSEAMIDNFLYQHQIPFHYEECLTLGEQEIYPDFTIRHPKTGETILWEHFGLMNNSHYQMNVCSKLQLYMTYGIIPSIHLITTYETKEYPLSSEMIEQIIEYYFL